MSLGETTSGKKNHRRVDKTESKDMADKTDGTDRTDMQNMIAYGGQAGQGGDVAMVFEAEEYSVFTFSIL